MMRNGKGPLRLIVGGCAEICWLYAWASFVMAAVTGRPYAFLSALCVFFLATVCTALSLGKGWRIIGVAAIQALGFGCAALMVLHGVYYSSYEVISAAWLADLLGNQRTPLEWVSLVLVIIWTLLFWISGALFVKRSKAYFTVCSRFDIGLAAFFCLFLAKLVMLAKGGMKVDDPFSLLLVYPFFLLSLISIGAARVESHLSKEFLPGYGGIGVMASFGAGVILTAASLILFFMPAMTVAAGMGYQVVKGGGGLIFPVLVGIVRFMFMGKGPRPEPAGASPKEHSLDWFGSPGTWWTDLIEKVIGWGIKGFVALFLLFMAGFILFLLIRWLLSRTGLAENRVDETGNRVSWWVRLWAAFGRFCRKVARSIRGYGSAAELYDALLTWGRHNGIRHPASETPLEFARRLDRFFPRLNADIGLIVSAFHEEVYAEDPSGRRLAHARSALYRLRSPFYWLLRAKVRFNLM